MSCTKNPKKFLGINYRGEHKWKSISFYPFMKYVRDNWVVKKECEYCGCIEEDHFITHSELLEMGFSNKEIEDSLW